PLCLRLGTLLAPAPLPFLPALAPFVGQGHLAVAYTPEKASAAIGLLQSLTLRIVALASPGSYRLVLVDPLNLGSSLASFLKLPVHVRGDKVFTQDDEIALALQQLVGDVEHVI